MTNTRKCTKCNENKKIGNFHTTKRKSKKGIKSYRVRMCKACYVKKNKEWYIASKSTLNGYFKSLIICTRARARKNKLKFNLTVEYLEKLFIKQQGKCAFSGEKLTISAGKGHINTNISVDRIDNSKNYTVDNVHLVCYIINAMKRNLLESEFINWCSKVSKQHQVMVT